MLGVWVCVCVWGEGKVRGVCDLGARNRFKNIKIEIDQYNVNKQKTGFFFYRSGIRLGYNN